MPSKIEAIVTIISTIAFLIIFLWLIYGGGTETVYRVLNLPELP